MIAPTSSMISSRPSSSLSLSSHPSSASDSLASDLPSPVQHPAYAPVLRVWLRVRGLVLAPAAGTVSYLTAAALLRLLLRALDFDLGVVGAAAASLLELRPRLLLRALGFDLGVVGAAAASTAGPRLLLRGLRFDFGVVGAAAASTAGPLLELRPRLLLRGFGFDFDFGVVGAAAASTAAPLLELRALLSDFGVVGAASASTAGTSMAATRCWLWLRRRPRLRLRAGRCGFASTCVVGARAGGSNRGARAGAVAAGSARETRCIVGAGSCIVGAGEEGARSLPMSSDTPPCSCSEVVSVRTLVTRLEDFSLTRVPSPPIVSRTCSCATRGLNTKRRIAPLSCPTRWHIHD